MSAAAQCPSCDEWIGADATWCLHCGSAVAATGTSERDGTNAERGAGTDGESASDDRAGGGVRPRSAARDREKPSVGCLEVALQFVNRYAWLRGTFAIAVLAAIWTTVATFQPRTRAFGSVVVGVLFLWAYAISRAGSKQILVYAAYGTVGLLVFQRLRAAVPRALDSEFYFAAKVLVDGPTLVVVAALIVGAQLLSTLVVQPPDPYGVHEDLDRPVRKG